MVKDDRETGRPGLSVPSGRLSRLWRMGGMAGGVAGNVVSGGLREMASGRRPDPAALLMTPANARRIADDLSRMRGAAMKVGQLLSMDAGDLLPPEIAIVLDRLREDADPMPPAQLRKVLDAEWGQGWTRRFARFDIRPVAAASIGQVHRALTKDGRDLAVKVQYPGIRNAIDSDVNNVAGLMRYSGLVPRTLDLGPLLDDAKRQLHEEADYAREGAALERFAGYLSGSETFAVPRLHADLSTENLLAMDYMPSVPLVSILDGPREVRDRVAADLIDLVLRELFEFAEMQTDPNFANYRYDPDTGRIVLLDFGATRRFADGLPAAFHRLMAAGLDRDREATRAAAVETGLFPEGEPRPRQEILLDMIDMGMAPLRRDAPFDFAGSDLALRMRDRGMSLGSEREFWHVPATDTLLIQRKVVGTYLLAARLRAQVALGPLVQAHRDRRP